MAYICIYIYRKLQDVSVRNHKTYIRNDRTHIGSYRTHIRKYRKYIRHYRKYMGKYKKYIGAYWTYIRNRKEYIGNGRTYIRHDWEICLKHMRTYWKHIGISMKYIGTCKKYIYIYIYIRHCWKSIRTSKKCARKHVDMCAFSFCRFGDPWKPGFGDLAPKCPHNPRTTPAQPPFSGKTFWGLDFEICGAVSGCLLGPLVATSVFPIILCIFL